MSIIVKIYFVELLKQLRTNLDSKQKIYLVYLPVLFIGLVSAVLLAKNFKLFTNFAAPPEDRSNNSNESVIEGTIGFLDRHDNDGNQDSVKYFLQYEKDGQFVSRELDYKGSKVPEVGAKVKVKASSINMDTGSIVVDETSGTGEITTLQSTASLTELNENTLLSATTVDVVAKTGYRKVLIVPLKWANTPATTVLPTRTELEADFDSVENYFYNESNRKLVFQNEVGDVLEWRSVGLNFSCQTYNDTRNSATFLNPIDTFVKSLGINYNTYKHIFVIMPVPDQTCAGSYGSNESWFATGTGMVRVPSHVYDAVWEHELAHTLNGDHSVLLNNCSASGVPGSCTGIDYTENYELLGKARPANGLPEGDAHKLSPFHKLRLGWQTLKNVRVVRSSGTYTIYTLDGTSSTNLPQNLQVCRDANTFYSIESRTATGVDAPLPGTMTNGVIVRVVGLNKTAWPWTDTRLERWPADQFMLSPGTGQNSLSVGSQFVDTDKGITIKALSKNTANAGVEVIYRTPPLSCPAAFGDPYRDYQILTDFDDKNISCGRTLYDKPEIWFGDATSQFDPACVAGNKHIAEIRFTNVQVAKFTTITSALLEFLIDGPFANTMTQKVTVYSPNITPSSPINWTISDAWNNDGEIRRSIDFKNAVQQIINNPSWAPGKDLIFKFEYGSGSGSRRIFSYKRSSDYKVPFTKLLLRTGAVVTPTPTPGPTGAIIYPDLSDSYVDSANPTTNYGSAITMAAKATPNKIALMYFNLQSLANRNISNATLKLYANNASAGTMRLRLALSNWHQDTVNWNNKPAMDTPFTTFIPSTVNAYKNIDISQFVRDHRGQLVTIAVDTISTDDFVFTSYDAFDSGHQPQLVITY